MKWTPRYIAGLLMCLSVGLVSIVKNFEEQIYIAPHIEKLMNQISSSYYLETSLCFEYKKVLEDVYIYSYYIPHIEKSTRNSVKAPCRGENLIPFHNHPHRDIKTDTTLQKAYLKATGRPLEHPNQMLYMSGKDTFHSVWFSHKYAIVGANGQWGWWSRDQFLWSYLRKKPILLYKDGQGSLKKAP